MVIERSTVRFRVGAFFSFSFIPGSSIKMQKAKEYIRYIRYDKIFVYNSRERFLMNLILLFRYIIIISHGL